MGAEAIFTSERVFKEDVFDGLQSERHIGAEEDEESEAREIRGEIGNSGRHEDAEEGKLAEDNSDEE